MRWQRGVVVYPVLAVVAAFATAWIEFAWYGLATNINPWRVLAVSESLNFGLRPAHYVFIVGVAVAVLVVGRKLVARFGRRPTGPVTAGSA